MAEDGGGFLSRWSARKAQARRDEEPAAAEAPLLDVAVAVVEPSPAASPAAAAAAELAAPLSATADVQPASAAEAAAAAAVADSERETPAPPPPTLEDVAALTADSDFSRFVGRAVDPGVRNAAMKKLFTAPNFNTMDGLDVYTEDFNTFEPLPKATFRLMLQARVLGLLDDELTEQPLPPGVPGVAAAEGGGVTAVDAGGAAPQHGDGEGAAELQFSTPDAPVSADERPAPAETPVLAEFVKTPAPPLEASHSVQPDAEPEPS